MILSQFVAWGQAGYSPYTSKGVGDIHSLGLTNNAGMGGVGISNGSGLFYNNANPALLYRNNLAVFSIGMTGEYRQTATDDLSQKNYTGGFNYLMLGLPLMVDRWTIGLGLMPYSTVNYKYNAVERVIGNPDAEVFKSFEGSGGFNKMFISNGLKIHKNFSVGLTVGYLFGSIKDEVTTQVRTQKKTSDSTTVNLLSNVVLTGTRLTMGDIYLLGGAVYRLPLSTNTSLNMGLTYELGGEKDSRIFQNMRNLSYSQLPVEDFANDTLNQIKGSVRLPSTLGIGLSYEKSYHWTIGADLLLSDWSEYQGFVGNGVGGNEDFQNTYSIAIGAEYIPDISSVDNYLKRMVYRAGITHERSPYKVNNEYIKDFGINFGVSFPVRNFSSFNLAFQLGQRGTTEKGLIKEKYFNVHLGVTFNDRWFVRRKFD